MIKLIEQSQTKKSRFLKYSLLASISVGAIIAMPFEGMATQETENHSANNEKNNESIGDNPIYEHKRSVASKLNRKPSTRKGRKDHITEVQDDTQLKPDEGLDRFFKNSEPSTENKEEKFVTAPNTPNTPFLTPLTSPEHIYQNTPSSTEGTPYQPTPESRPNDAVGANNTSSNRVVRRLFDNSQVEQQTEQSTTQIKPAIPLKVKESANKVANEVNRNSADATKLINKTVQKQLSKLKKKAVDEAQKISDNAKTETSKTELKKPQEQKDNHVAMVTNGQIEESIKELVLIPSTTSSLAIISELENDGYEVPVKSQQQPVYIQVLPDLENNAQKEPEVQQNSNFDLSVFTENTAKLISLLDAQETEIQQTSSSSQQKSRDQALQETKNDCQKVIKINQELQQALIRKPKNVEEYSKKAETKLDVIKNRADKRFNNIETDTAVGFNQDWNKDKYYTQVGKERLFDSTELATLTKLTTLGYSEERNINYILGIIAKENSVEHPILFQNLLRNLDLRKQEATLLDNAMIDKINNPDDNESKESIALLNKVLEKYNMDIKVAKKASEDNKKNNRKNNNVRKPLEHLDLALEERPAPPLRKFDALDEDLQKVSASKRAVEEKYITLHAKNPNDSQLEQLALESLNLSKKESQLEQDIKGIDPRYSDGSELSRASSVNSISDLVGSNEDLNEEFDELAKSEGLNNESAPDISDTETENMLDQSLLAEAEESEDEEVQPVIEEASKQLFPSSTSSNDYALALSDGREEQDDNDSGIEEDSEEAAEQLSDSEENILETTAIDTAIPLKQEAMEEAKKTIAATVPTLNQGSKIIKSVGNLITSTRLDTAVAAGDEEEVRIKRGLWVRGMYGINNHGRVENINGYRGTNKGATIGFDVEIDNNIVGIAYSNVHSVFKFKNSKNNDKEIIDSHVVSIYGQKELPKNFVVQALASASKNFIKDKTTYSYGDTKIKSNVNHRNHSYNVEALLNYNYLVKNNLVITPNIGLRYGKSRDGVYNETGINVQEIALTMKENNILSGIVGTKVKVPLKDALKFNNLGLTFQGAVEHNFKEKTQRINRVVKIFDTEFKQDYAIPKQSQTSYNLGTGIMGSIKNTTISLDYNYYLNKHYRSHQGSIKLKVNL